MRPNQARAWDRAMLIAALSALAAAATITTARADTVLATEGLMQRPGKTATAFQGAFCQHGCRSVNNPTGLFTGFTNLARGADRLESAAEAVDGPVSLIGWSLGAAVIDEQLAEWGGTPPPIRQVVTFGSPNNERDRNRDFTQAVPDVAPRLNVVAQYDIVADKPARLGWYSAINLSWSQHWSYFAADINDPANLVYRDGSTTHMLIEADVLPMLRWRDWFTSDERIAQLDAKYRPLVERDYDRPTYVEQGAGADWANGVEPETLRDSEVEVEEESWSVPLSDGESSNETDGGESFSLTASEAEPDTAPRGPLSVGRTGSRALTERSEKSSKEANDSQQPSTTPSRDSDSPDPDDDQETPDADAEPEGSGGE